MSWYSWCWKERVPLYFHGIIQLVPFVFSLHQWHNKTIMCHCLQKNMKLAWIPWNLSFGSVISTCRCCPHQRSKSSIFFLRPRVRRVRWPRTCSNFWCWKEEFLFTSMVSFNQFHLSSHGLKSRTKPPLKHKMKHFSFYQNSSND